MSLRCIFVRLPHAYPEGTVIGIDLETREVLGEFKRYAPAPAAEGKAAPVPAPKAAAEGPSKPWQSSDETAWQRVGKARGLTRSLHQNGMTLTCLETFDAMEEPLTAKSLTILNGFTLQQAASLCNKLYSYGFIERRSLKSDGRELPRLEYRITPSGRKYLLNMRKGN